MMESLIEKAQSLVDIAGLAMLIAFVSIVLAILYKRK